MILVYTHGSIILHYEKFEIIIANDWFLVVYLFAAKDYTSLC